MLSRDATSCVHSAAAAVRRSRTRRADVPAHGEIVVADEAEVAGTERASSQQASGSAP